MKKYIHAILFISILYPGLLWAACSVSGTNLTATSASQADINDCIALATYGDTVNVPAGTVTWDTDAAYACGSGHNQGLCITKGIHLKGAGIGSTVITCASADANEAIIYIAPDAPTISNDHPIEVSGFTFDGNDTASYIGQIYITSTSTTPITNVKIHDNKFQDAPITANGTGRAIEIHGLIYGTAYKNQIDRVAMSIGVHAGSETAWANSTQAYGSANNFYFEDNLITISSACTYNGEAVCLGHTAVGQGGKLVVRYNTWDYAGGHGDNDTLWDVHGLQSMKTTAGGDCQTPGGCNPTYANAVDKGYCEEYSTMVFELYGNSIKGRTDASNGVTIGYVRGGWSIFANNKITTTTSSVPEIVWLSYACDSCQSLSEIKYTQHISNTYQWNIFSDATRLAWTKGAFDMCGEEYYVNSTTYSEEAYDTTEDTDFYSDKYATFDGTSGVGCGSSLPETCTANKAAYYVTSQSCTDISPIVGARGIQSENRTSEVSGILYKCTGTNTWTQTWTPYTYPHPLRGETSGGAGHSFSGGATHSFGSGSTITWQ